LSEKALDTKAAIEVLNRILELELAGVVRYTQYSFMVFGYTRIPIVAWLRGQADESLLHAHEAGELVTQLGGHPSLGVGPLLEKHHYEIGDILRESLEHEEAGIAAYAELLALAEGRSILLEEYARRLIGDETKHVGEVHKMLRAPGNAPTA
jgi:bacterioferritin